MKTLLAIGDAGCNTGFARVTKGVCDYLHATGEWDVQVRGINCQSNHTIPYEYEVLPITPNHAVDPFGFDQFPEHIAAVKPDAIWMVQDLWNITRYMGAKKRDLPTVAYFPVDCPNLKWEHVVGLGQVAEAAAYTHFGAREAAAGVRDLLDLVSQTPGAASINDPQSNVRGTWFSVPAKGKLVPCRIDRMARWQNIDGWNVIPHGIDAGGFEPRDQATCRKLFGIPEDAFVVGHVSTNQFRKRQDLLLRVFAEILKVVPNAVLVMHCMGGATSQAGWDLPQACRLLGIAPAVRAVHQHYQQLTDDDLCSLYNTMDVHVNTAGGEGWGLSSFEAAACGVPQAVPDWSATRELWRGHPLDLKGAYGLLLPVKEWRLEPRMLNTAHCEIDVERSAQMILRLRDPDAHAHFSQRATVCVAEQCSWAEVGAGFETLLNRALVEPPATPMSMAEVRQEREGDAQSELWRCATMDDHRARLQVLGLAA